MLYFFLGVLMIKKIFVLLFIIYIFPVFAQKIDMPEVSWKLAFLKKNGSETESKKISETINMADSEQYQIYLEPSSVAFCYILDETPEGVFFEMFRTPLKPNRAVFLPDASEWYVLTPPNGTEKIHVVVSSRPLKSLERVLDSLNRNTNSMGTSGAVADEIKALKKIAASNKIEIASDKITPERNPNALITDLDAVMFSGSGIYIQTISVIH